MEPPTCNKLWFVFEQDLRAGGRSLPSRPPVEDPEAGTTEIDNLIEKAAAASQGDLRDSLYLSASFKLLQLRQYEKGKELPPKSMTGKARDDSRAAGFSFGRRAR